MSGMNSGDMSARWFVRQTTKPASEGPPFEWLNPEAGPNGDNRERYTWNPDTQEWELSDAVGPDTPQNPATGALWRDTLNGSQKVNTDGTDTGWENIGVNDHGNLTNVTAAQHHARPTTGNALTEDANGNFDVQEGNIDHSNLASVTSGQHHAKTTSAADLTDVSPDSTANAHHSRPTGTGTTGSDLGYRDDWRFGSNMNDNLSSGDSGSHSITGQNFDDVEADGVKVNFKIRNSSPSGSDAVDVDYSNLEVRDAATGNWNMVDSTTFLNLRDESDSQPNQTVKFNMAARSVDGIQCDWYCNEGQGDSYDRTYFRNFTIHQIGMPDHSHSI